MSDPPLVWIIAPPKDRSSTLIEAKRKELDEAAVAAGWDTRTRRPKAVKVRPERQELVLEPYDADEIYRSAHRRQVAVLALVSVRVLKDPMADPAQRNLLNLMRLVRHKAYFGNVNNRFPVDDQIAGFGMWIADVRCGGERDARCLPLHTFSPSGDWEDLESPDGIKAFEAAHGGPNSRADEALRDWNPPNALHGREVLTVAGAPLRAGFHWDVVSHQSAGRLTTSAEVWKFARDAYVNVYPDAGVREGQSSGKSAKRIHRSTRPAAPLAREPRQGAGRSKRGRRRK